MECPIFTLPMWIRLNTFRGQHIEVSQTKIGGWELAQCGV